MFLTNSIPNWSGNYKPGASQTSGEWGPCRLELVAASALGRASLISRLHGLANTPTTAGRPPADNCLGSPVIVGEGLCAAASRSRLWRRYRGHSNRGPSTAGSRTKNVSGYIVKRASPPANRKVAVHHGRTLRRCSGRRMSVVGGIVLQKSFCTGVQKFSGPWARSSDRDARDLIASR